MKQVSPTRHLDLRRSTVTGLLLVIGVALLHYSVRVQADSQNPDPASQAFAQAESFRAEQRADANKQAIEKYLQAGESWLASEQYELAAGSYRCAGEVYVDLGDLPKAIDSFQKALDLNQKTANPSEEVKILNGLAYANFLRGDSQSTHDLSLKALNLAQQLDDSRLEAAALSNLGESFFSVGDLPTAQRYQQQAIDLWTRSGDFQGLAMAQIAMGYYSANLSEPQSALGYLSQGLEAAGKSNNLRTQLLALNATANLKAKFGRKQEALAAYSEAQPLAERIGDRLFMASVLGGLDALYSSLGQPQAALEFALQSQKLFGEIEATWGLAEATLDVGRIKNGLGQNDAALQDLNEALTLFRKLNMRRLEAQTLSEIGVALTATGDYNGALASLNQARKMFRSGQDFRFEANALNLIGRLYEKQNNPKQAFQFYQNALDLSRQAQDQTSESDALFNLAKLERDRGNLIEAEKHVESAIELAESIRAQVAGQNLKASYSATIHQIYELNIDILMRRYQAEPHADFAARALALSEKARARSLVESLRQGPADIREGVDPNLLEKERVLSDSLNAKAERQLKLSAAKKVDEAAKLQTEIDELTAEYTSVRDQIKATAPRYASLTATDPLSLQEIQNNLLDANTTLVEYSLGEDRSYVWVITAKDLFSSPLPARKEIEDSARQLYTSLSSNQESNTSTAALSKLLLEPLSGKLGHDRLLIIADGALQYIPFQALNDPDSTADLLIKNHEIVYEPSASTLAVLLNEAKQRKPAPNSVAVLADPVFESDDPRVTGAATQVNSDSAESNRVKQAVRDLGISQDGVQIPRLYSSAREADAIMNYAPWGTALKAVGFQANRTRILGPELANYRVVHFATHGLINNEHPELSGIVFSLFDQQGRSQDGFLRLHDIYNLRLPADLVVLSACSTGLGKDVRGEGLIGLTRGFMYAGASGVVASLWKVDDEATAELMKLFYEGLFKRGLSPAAALREAQLQMAQQKAWQSPYYWAGFVIQGRYNEQVSVSYFSYLTTKRIVLLLVVILALSTATILVLRRRRRRIFI
ncbi:MAG TPA: CHAT domain-containing protein [Pyrinomonadaceae bacterium]